MRLHYYALVSVLLLAACSSDTPLPTDISTQPQFYTYANAIYRNHTEFGVPKDASSTNDLLINRRTYSLSYNCAEGEANWVSWDLNKTHYGDAARSTTFTTDTSLPSGCYRVTTTDYTNSGYSRGHMVRSEERTWSVDDNKTTFILTNIVPQMQDLNGGPWYKLEQYCQDLAQNQNKELYVISGPIGNKGTLKGAGKVVIPTYTFKIIVVMPYGQGLANVTSTSSIQVIAVKMPNVSGISTQPWTAYKTTVNDIENLTKYNFLDKLPDTIETYWEAKVY